MPTLAGKSTLASVGVGLLVALVALGGCGSSQGSAAASGAGATLASCQATVLAALDRVVGDVYHEGVASERTLIARRTIVGSSALRAAIESGSPAAVHAAATKLLAGGRITDLTIVREGHVLLSVGVPALAPLTGAITDAAGGTIATYRTSVWSDEGFLAESDSLAEARVALREGGVSVGGSQALAAGPLPASGSIVVHHVRYRYASFAGTSYPGGALRVYVLRSVASTVPLCGADSEQTTVRTLGRVATLIYDGEAGPRTLRQVRRVQGDRALLAAVARRDPLATTAQVRLLLNQHIVRLRVIAAGNVLADVGGPYVLAPVTAPLRLAGHTVGTLVLSIQDDEGYLRLARRLAGLRVLMYMGSQLVKNSLGPEPGPVPESGRYEYRGSTFAVTTLHVTAFPSGPLTIDVLIPLPYD